MLHFYYTKWKFKQVHEGLDSKGPFHSTWITERNFQEMLMDTNGNDLEEFFIKEFISEEEMTKFWESMNK